MEQRHSTFYWFEMHIHKYRLTLNTYFSHIYFVLISEKLKFGVHMKCVTVTYTTRLTHTHTQHASRCFNIIYAN